MKEIAYDYIVDTVKRLCVESNYQLGQDVIAALERARAEEPSPQGQEILDQILRNAAVAGQEEVAMCQDTGLVVCFVELGQEAHIAGGLLNEAIHEGVRQGYQEGFLRKSVVYPPYGERKNTGDNTPAVIHIDLVPGDTLRIILAPKGGGSENMSFLNMMPPSAGREGIINWVVECVDRAGANPCPPIIVGVGIGGTIDKVTQLAKRALLRAVGQPSHDRQNAALERDLLERINRLGIGPAGLGGRTTALAAHVETFPCHIASMPVAVNIQCHAARHKEATM